MILSHQSLLDSLKQPEILVAPGGYDALTAALIEQGGFKAMYLSGASIAYTRLGKPDIGLVSMSEVADTLSCIRERVSLPVIVDADTGFGNALNVIRTVQLFERCGASGIQLEDQSMPKRCGHLKGKSLISQQEMVGKVKAAVDARQSHETLIIARTDAIAVEGFDTAMERAESYREAGADVLFIEAPENLSQMEIINKTFAQKIPLLANMVEGGATPIKSTADLQSMGYSLAIFPGAMVRVLSFAAQNYLQSLSKNGNTSSLTDQMHDLTSLNQLLGTNSLLELGKQYD